ncbi:MAG: prolyl-tRNA synthetase associated domain-containing protein [Candidatus Dependentiae bacterium]|nr:prolyl-tRNA synthetase associated domain-containing protein [Candidatus Dependentiae bacterium]
MNTVEQFLTSHDITYRRHEHPAVFTCEEAALYCAHIPGIASKNLFLTNPKRTRFFLATIPDYKRADLKKFAALVGEMRVAFGSAELLRKKLGLEPGSVSPFGLINNHEKDVEVFIDADVYDAPIVGFHPNINTATLELTDKMFKKFFEVAGYHVQVFAA